MNYGPPGPLPPTACPGRAAAAEAGPAGRKPHRARAEAEPARREAATAAARRRAKPVAAARPATVEPAAKPARRGGTGAAIGGGSAEIG